MFPQKYRLRKENDIIRVFKKGRRLFSKYFNLLYLPNNTDTSRATVTVTKKYDKRATKRNQLKRKFREIAHNLVIYLQPGRDIVILSRKCSEDASFQEVQKEILKAFERIQKESNF